MGIRVACPNCNKQLNVKSFLAGKRGVCPDCHTKFDIPAGSEHNVVLEVEESESAKSVWLADAPPSQQVISPPMVAAPRAAAPLAPSFVPAPPAAWHVCSAMGERHGPLPEETLRQWIAQRRVQPDSLVWREGWADWQRADSVFAELAPVAPPPLMAAPMAVPVSPAGAPPVIFPAAQTAAFEPFPREPPRPLAGRSYGRRTKNSHVVILVLLILGLLVLAPLLGYVLVQQF